MNIDKLSDNWLFQNHPKFKVIEWVNSLKYFYYIRAWGGHANDGDRFKVLFRYDGRTNLLNKLSHIGVKLEKIPADYPRPIVGKSYPYEEFKLFKNEIPGNEDLEQPGHTIIFDKKVFIWVDKASISISVFGNLDGNFYEVLDVDFKICQELEMQFDKLEWQKEKDKNIEESVCCISMSKYPELYIN